MDDEHDQTIKKDETYTVNEKLSMVDMVKLQKMAFVFNALDNGWSIKKRNGYYVFKKNHGGREEIFLDSYLSEFIRENIGC